MKRGRLRALAGTHAFIGVAIFESATRVLGVSVVLYGCHGHGGLDVALIACPETYQLA
jgi:hypothetical protein